MIIIWLGKFIKKPSKETNHLAGLNQINFIQQTSRHTTALRGYTEDKNSHKSHR